MYIVIRHFTDLHDADHKYVEGDIFPRKGVKVADRRIAELASEANKQGVPLIAFVEDEPVKEEKAEAEKPKRKKKASAE